ncbi:YbaN family protein [Bergeriella denitrificans]|uniref:YbaN family protein n=1 Tax=Bergeriella denitrificans TaxID=494 RepID=UPI0008247B0C|nr:YbaN family protein [Bergeriella denitrificans]
MVRWFFWCCGALALALGIIGIFQPLLPTTPFVLLAASCWAKASPRFHHWLLCHPYFGPMVRNWQQKRAVPRRAKFLAVGMMTVSCGLLFWQVQPWHIPAAASLLCAAVAVWMLRLPDA